MQENESPFGPSVNHDEEKKQDATRTFKGNKKSGTAPPPETKIERRSLLFGFMQERSQKKRRAPERST